MPISVTASPATGGEGIEKPVHGARIVTPNGRGRPMPTLI